MTETVLEGAKGSTMAHITNEAISIDKQLQTEQNYLLKLQRTKAGTMSDSLSGKKSVTVKE